MKIKRIFAGLLAVVTCASVLPFTAFAEESDVSYETDLYDVVTLDSFEERYTGVSWTTFDGTTPIATDGYYQLVQDVTLESTLTIGDGTNAIEVVLDLNGYALALMEGSTESSVIEIKSNTTFTLEDSSESGSGVITGGNAKNGGGVSNAGTFTMYNGTISGNKATSYGGGVYNDGTFTMYDGTISENTANYGGGISLYPSNTGNDVTFTMNGGTIIGNEDINGAGGISIQGNSRYQKSSTVIIGTENSNIYANTSTKGSQDIYSEKNTTFSLSEKVNESLPDCAFFGWYDKDDYSISVPISEEINECGFNAKYGMYGVTYMIEDESDGYTIAGTIDPVYGVRGDEAIITLEELPDLNFSNAYCDISGWNTESDGSGTRYESGSVISYEDIPEGGLVLYPVYSEHNLIRLEYDVEPTCSNPGHTACYFCKNCGKYFSDKESFVVIGQSDGDESEDGIYKSSESDYNLEDSGYIIPAKGHDFTIDEEDGTCDLDYMESVPVATATCSTSGHKAYVRCKQCGKYFLADGDGDAVNYDDDIVISPLGHDSIWDEENEENVLPSYMEFHEAENSTCITKGHTEYYFCTSCGQYFEVNSDGSVGDQTTFSALQNEEINETNHAVELQKLDAVAATCSEPGHIACYYCSACGKYFDNSTGAVEIPLEDVFTEELDENAHGDNINLIPAVAATCVEDGHEAYWHCSACGKNYAVTEDGDVGDEYVDENGVTYIPTLPADSKSHSLVDVAEREATCAETGHIACKYCEYCGKYFTIDGTEITKENRSDVEIAKNNDHGNNIELVSAVEATCSESGHEAYYHCTACGKYYYDAEGTEEITDLDDIAIPAICDDETLTDEEKSELLADPENHTLSNVVPVATSTCSLEGHEAYYQCEDCGMYFTVDSEEKTDEETGETTSTTKPGTATTYDDLIIDTLGHDKDKEYMTFVDATEANCAIGGHNAYYHCSQCGRYFDVDKSGDVGDELVSIETTEKDSRNHVGFEIVAEVASTCSEHGHDSYYRCTGCGECFKINEDGSVGNMITDMSDIAKELDPTAHVLVSVDAVEPTCTTTGHVAYDYCEHCGTYFVDGKKVDAESLTIAIDPDAHTLEFVAETDSTCSEHGHYAYAHCTECDVRFYLDEDSNIGDEFDDISAVQKDLDPTAHVIVSVDAVDPTCTTTGHVAYDYCEHCGTYFVDGEKVDADSLTIAIDPDAHDIVELNAVDPTCATLGHTACQYCGRCGTYFTMDGEIVTEENENEIWIDIDPDAHTLIHVEATEPTYDSVGNIEYWYCSGCGTYFADEVATIQITYSDTVIPMLTETEVSETTEPVVSETTEPVMESSETSETTEATTAGVTVDTTEESETTEPVIETTEPVMESSETSETTETTTAGVTVDTTEESETTEPVVSETTEPVVSETTEPVVSETTESIVSETTESIVSETTESVMESSETVASTETETTETTTEPTDSEEDFGVLGDMDEDDEISPTDAYYVLVAYASEQLTGDNGLREAQFAFADVNCDGVVDPTDAYYILCYYAVSQLTGSASWEDILANY